MKHYSKASAQADLPIRYFGLNDPETFALWGLTSDEAVRQFHVRKNGQIYGDVSAFVVLWRDIPQMRWRARIIKLPSVHFLACKVYGLLLSRIPHWMHLRRQSG